MYLTPAAIGYLTQLILAALISGYLGVQIGRSRRPTHTLWLAGFFATLTLFLATLFLEAALLPTPRLGVVLVQNAFLAVAITCLLQFAYHFSTLPPSLHREARLALWLGILYTLWESGFAVFRFARLGAGVVEYRPNWSDYLLLAFLLWVPLALFRNLYHRAPPGSQRRRRFIASLRHPPDHESRTIRSFGLLFLFVAGLSLFNILRSAYLLSVDLANAGISLGILGALFAFAAAYLNYQPETTSFMVKLAGVTLTVMLAIMASVGWVVSPLYEAQYNPDLPHRQALRFTPNDRGGYDLAPIPFAWESDLGLDLRLDDGLRRGCSEPLSFPFFFFGQAHDQVYACNDGVVSVGQPARYREYQYRYGAGTPLIMALLMDLDPTISAGGIFARQESDRLVITWDRLRGFRRPDAEFTFQAILYPDGVLEFAYEDLPVDIRFEPNDDPGASPWAVGLVPGGLWRDGPRSVTLANLPVGGGPAGMVHDYVLTFRRHLHKLLAPLAWLILIASGLIVTGFPLLFYLSLVNPLNALLGGVRRLEEGEYATQVPVQYPDEIGFLTGAFNDLAARLGDLIQNLEARVADRTAELSARTRELDATNAQLRAEITEREQARATVLEQQRVLATFEERERLGRELHDGLGQVLGYINVQVQATETLLAQERAEAARSNLRQLAQVARQAHDDVRAYILGLRAEDETVPGEPQGLVQVLRAYLAQFETRYELAPRLWLAEDLPEPLFASGVEEQVLRIVQEALTNAGKHARASRIDVAFGLVGDLVQITVTDDGVGFTLSDLGGSAAAEPARPHFGLSIMRERAERVGGRLEIQSAPGQGTRITATLPRFLPAEGEGAEAQIESLRLLLVDDHPLFLDGLHNLLLARGLTVVGLARDGNEALAKARALRPDVVVMDLHMPHCDGLAATRAIKAELPEVQVVILTVAEDEESLFEAIKSGASGYLLKSLEANEFCALLTGLLRGEAPLSPGMAERILTEFARAVSPRSARGNGGPDEVLTPRQWEILCLVADGMIYKEIAESLCLSEKTIKYHMGQIVQKLHVESRAQAIAYAHRHRQE